jgi:hypothetical protein
VKYIVVVDMAPRSRKTTFYIAKQRSENPAIYDVQSKGDYGSEALERVEELNAQVPKHDCVGSRICPICKGGAL